MSTLLYLSTWISLLTSVSFAADCASQTNPDSCAATSGCEWFNNQCICATNVAIDYIFAVDVSGSIGWEGFQQEKMFLEDFVQQGLTTDARVGWTFFSTDVNSSRINLTRWTTDELITYVQNIYYPGGWTNTADVLQAILDEYDAHGTDSRQKLVIMPTDGNPCAPGKGNCPYDVCEYGPPIKAANIQIVVLGVGPDLTPQYLTCLLQNEDQDYIPVTDYNYDDFKKILPQLQNITCPVNYDMKLTEVKVQPDPTKNYPEYGSIFIEIYNTGSEVELFGEISIFSPLVDVYGFPPGVSFKQGQYLVLYQKGTFFTNVTCVDCTCNPDFVNNDEQKLPPAMFKCADSLYLECGEDSLYCNFNNKTMKDWYVQINDTGAGANTLINEVKYVAGEWPTIQQGWTYKLKALGFDNTIGTNWEQSCYTFGTPGDPPITCDNICNGTTADLNARCKANGDSSAGWNSAAGRCSCGSTGWYPTGCTCKPIPMPSNCVAYRIKNSTKTWYTQYVWDRADYEGAELEYQLTYVNKDGQPTVVSSTAATKRVLEYDWDRFGVNNSAGTLQPVMLDKPPQQGGVIIGRGETTDCMPVTMEPTVGPTPNPTFSPTQAPTDQPTLSPTRPLPWIFIGGICTLERCECGVSDRIKQRDCCMDEADECNTYFRTYSANAVSSGSADNGRGDKDKDQFITIQAFTPSGEFYSVPFPTNVYYFFEYIGLSNLTNDTTPRPTSSPTSASMRRLLDRPNQQDQPMMITPLTGTVNFDGSGESSTSSVRFFIKGTPAKPVPKGGDAIFRLTLVNCTSNYSLNTQEECEIVFPYQYLLYIPQVQPGNSALSWYERELEPYIWWIVGALAAFLLIIAMLVYWCWNKTRLKGKAIMAKEADLEQLIEEEENGMAPDLNKDDVGYNPLALGGGAGPHIGSGYASMDRNKEIPKNERANVIVEKFEERVEYGQKHGQMVDEDAGYAPPQLS